MKLRHLLAASVLAMSVAAGGASHATTYLLNVDGCSGGCGYTNYGTVSVTGQGTGALAFDIELATNVFFNQAGQPEEAFSLIGNPTITIAGLPSTFTANGSQAAGSHHEDGFGNWDYAIDWVGPPTNNSTLGVQSLTFTVTGPSPLNLDNNFAFGSNVFFVVDVASVVGNVTNTGWVGGTLHGGNVPEPATWALMILGMGGVGAVLRSRRRRGLAIA